MNIKDLSEFVKKEDYLKVVEEKELYKNKFEKLMSDDRYLKKIEELEKELYILKETHVEYVEKKTNDRIKFEKELKEKDEEINELKNKLKIINHEKVLYKNSIGENSLINEITKLNEVILKDKSLVKINELEFCVKVGDEKIEELYDRLSEANNEIMCKNKELLGLDIRCESLEEENDRLRNDLSYERNFNKNVKNELEKRNEEIKELKLKLDKKECEEKLWILEYGYMSSEDEFSKTVRLDPQPKEELFELIGMDSDNWIWLKMEEVE